jgi:DNA-binding transcriptional ArsR family regulator
LKILALRICFWGLSNFCSRKHLFIEPPRKVSGADLTETDEYDKIFAALKHPVRRQIMLYLDEQGEASFTQIQSILGIDDTGLVSYHLKELTPLVEQSERGKYSLSVEGQAGVELFRKVEREKQRSSVAVRSEVEKYLGETIVAAVLFLGITFLTLGVPMWIDILLTVQGVVRVFSLFELATVFLVSFLVMVFGIFLFTIYDLHYYSKTVKKSIIHCTVYAVGVALVGGLMFFQLQSFAMFSSNAFVFPAYFRVLRAAGFMASAPVVAYVFSKAKSRR